PFIPRCLLCFPLQDNEAWLVMDYVGGGSVSDILEACEVTLSEEEARECTAWTVLALEYLHSNRKLHRDVKAGNILLTLDGRAKLADFGVSKEVNTMANKAQTAIGTPYWMAPEVIQEVPYDGQADIWSLAITCIEMVEGNPPLNNVHPMRAIFMIPSKPSPTLSEPAKWSLEFNDFVVRCLEKKPEERPTSRALLRHPWIAASVAAIQERGGEGGSGVIRDLVAQHLPVLTSFREDASDAKANLVGEQPEDISGCKTATLRRMSSSRGGELCRGNGQSDAGFMGAANGTIGEESDSDGSVIRVPLGDDGDDDEGYSSGGSMIRVPVAGDARGDDDRSSSNGSVITVNVDEDDGCSSEGSVLRVPVDVGEADDCGSDGSVVRPPEREELLKGDVSRQLGQIGGKPESPLNRLTAEVLAFQGGAGHGGTEQTAASHEGAGQGPARAMKMNLQAAAKYFAKGGQGGTSQDCGAVAATQGKGDGSAQTNGTGEINPQAQALLNEIGRLDIAFANDLARLRESYDAKKAALQAELRACSDRQRATPAV
ncbi:unnamed protein product, partial [Laminaria digitata]